MASSHDSTPRRLLRENGLSLVTFGLFFVIFLVGQTFAGHRAYNAVPSPPGRSTP